jgi:hypothetical protein
VSKENNENVPCSFLMTHNCLLRPIYHLANIIWINSYWSTLPFAHSETSTSQYTSNLHTIYSPDIKFYVQASWYFTVNNLNFCKNVKWDKFHKEYLLGVSFLLSSDKIQWINNFKQCLLISSQFYRSEV